MVHLHFFDFLLNNQSIVNEYERKMNGILHSRQVDMKHCPLMQFTFYMNAAIMEVNDFLRDGKT
jgi:hypothetical protein